MTSHNILCINMVNWNGRLLLTGTVQSILKKQEKSRKSLRGKSVQGYFLLQFSEITAPFSKNQTSSGTITKCCWVFHTFLQFSRLWKIAINAYGIVWKIRVNPKKNYILDRSSVTLGLIFLCKTWTTENKHWMMYARGGGSIPVENTLTSWW